MIIKPHIPKRVKEVLRMCEDGTSRAQITGERNPWPVNRIKREVCQPLIDKFQARCRTPIMMVCCNGSFWLAENESGHHPRYTNLSDALDMTSNPADFGWPQEGGKRNWVTEAHHRYYLKVMRRFPELCVLTYIAFELDSMPGRPGIGTLKPTKTK